MEMYDSLIPPKTHRMRLGVGVSTFHTPFDVTQFSLLTQRKATREEENWCRAVKNRKCVAHEKFADEAVDDYVNRVFYGSFKNFQCTSTFQEDSNLLNK